MLNSNVLRKVGWLMKAASKRYSNNIEIEF